MISFIKKHIVATTITTGLLFASPASALTCDIKFKYDVIIDPSHIRLLERGITLVQINDDKQLFIKGREHALNTEQQDLLNEYARGIRHQIPTAVSIAIEGVDAGLKAVNKVIAGVTGENSASHQQLQRKFDELQWQLRKRFNHRDDNYYIASQDFDDFDEIFTGAFEQEIEALVMESVGTMLGAVGDAMVNKVEGQGESRASTFDNKIDGMSDGLQLEISGKVDAIKAKAASFCEDLNTLNDVEAELVSYIPALQEFDLIVSK